MAKSKTRTKKAGTTKRSRKVKIVAEVVDDLSSRVAAAGQLADGAVIQLDPATDEQFKYQLSILTPDSSPLSSLQPPTANQDASAETPQTPQTTTDQAQYHLRRFAQYRSRYERREERVAAAKLKLVWERDILKNHEQWRADDWATVYHEMNEASSVIAESMVSSGAKASFEKLKAAMGRVADDEENIRKQERVVSKHEEALNNAEASLHRVLESMLRAARKCLEYNGIQQPETDDLISSSTLASATRKTSRPPKPSIPPIVTRYFEKKADERIMFERLMELEYERKEELERRELEQERGEVPDESAVDFADATWDREHILATRDYEQALAEFEDAEEQCKLDGYNPDDFRNTYPDDADDDEDDRSDLADATTAQAALQKTASDTFLNLAGILRRLETVGPDPEDPTGMVNTTLRSDIAAPSLALPLPAETSADKPTKHIVTWMSNVEEIQPPRVYKDDSPASIDNSGPTSSEHVPRSTQIAQSPQPDESASNRDLHIDRSDVAHAGSQSEPYMTQDVQDGCMDEHMLMTDAQTSEQTFADENQLKNKGRRPEPDFVDLGPHFEAHTSTAGESTKLEDAREELNQRPRAQQRSVETAPRVQVARVNSNASPAPQKSASHPHTLHLHDIVRHVMVLKHVIARYRKNSRQSEPKQQKVSKQPPGQTLAGQDAAQAVKRHDTMQPEGEAKAAQSESTQLPAPLAPKDQVSTSDFQSQSLGPKT